jgi:hypothetical protein
MPALLTDNQIAVLITEAKTLPPDYRSRVLTKPKRGHRERELDVDGAQGSRFRIILRQSLFNSLDFSAILSWLPPQSTTPFRLCRFNGKSHEHTNSIEGKTFYDFHIHRATERYQEFGSREDTFAEPTSRYQDLAGALRCLFADCGFQLPPGDQSELF